VPSGPIFAARFDWETISIFTNLRTMKLTDSAGPRAKSSWLRVIAVFEAAKGLLVLLTGLGLLSLLHRDVEMLAEELVARRLLIHHLRLSGVLLRAAENVTDGKLLALASVALAYAAMRFVEAYGLWNQREWGQWFALLSAILYLPWEILAIIHHPTAAHYGLVFFNIALISYLTWMRQSKA
jgi:uncharacterized membrane protein (DUF2068 family)